MHKKLGVMPVEDKMPWCEMVWKSQKLKKKYVGKELREKLEKT